MLKAVIDTNILVSALLKPNSTPDLCLQLVFDGKVELIVSDEIISEYLDVLNYSKFGFQKVNIEIFINKLHHIGTQVTRDNEFTSTQYTIDPADQKFLQAGLEANFIITGNKRHFPKRINQCLIVTPAEFIEHITDIIEIT